jgi:CRISPR-associated protein Csx17
MLGIHKIGPLRANLEPVDWKKAGRTWAEKDRSVVWNSADLCTNLTSVLARRLMDGQKAGCENLPLDSTASASLAAISAFLAGQVDDNRIVGKPRSSGNMRPRRSSPCHVPTLC